MKKLLGMALATVLVAAPAFAKDPKSYQVTGQVVSTDNDVIVVLKGKEKWEIAKGKVDKDVKPGDKITVTYKMTADSIDVKSSGKAEADGGTAKSDAKSDAKTESKSDKK